MYIYICYIYISIYILYLNVQNKNIFRTTLGPRYLQHYTPCRYSRYSRCPGPAVTCCNYQWVVPQKWTNVDPEKGPISKRTWIIFQPSIFRGYWDIVSFQGKNNGLKHKIYHLYKGQGTCLRVLLQCVIDVSPTPFTNLRAKTWARQRPICSKAPPRSCTCWPIASTAKGIRFHHWNCLNWIYPLGKLT